ncbi:MAG: nucleotide exchange factor GrpE, partial [Vicinamibacteria bacterium]|nr:nucleotide exchange factor GrpE [Vicinamibacteria bacterium]
MNDLDLNDAADPPATGETAPSGDDLTKAVDEREQLRDRLLRTAAEFDNFRKRVDRDRREQADRAAESLLLDLLPVVDDLERALAVEATGEGAESYRRGIELIHKQLA